MLKAAKLGNLNMQTPVGVEVELQINVKSEVQENACDCKYAIVARTSD